MPLRALTRRLTRWRITPALTFSAVGILALSVAFITAIDALQIRSLYIESLEREGLLLAETLDEPFANALYFSDVEQLRHLTDVLRSQRDFQRFAVFNSQGRVVVDSGTGKYVSGQVGADILGRLSGDQPQVTRGDDVIEVLAPIRAGRELLGGVLLQADPSGVAAEIRELIWQHALQGGVVILLGLVLAYSLAQSLKTPVRELVSATRQVARGEPIPAREVERRDEIGDLMRSFQEMVAGLEKRAGDQAAALAQAEKMESVGRLAGGVAHDFNNLLASIIGFVDLARIELPASDDAHPYLSRIRDSADRAADLTRQLLAFARPEQAEPRLVDMGGHIGAAETLVRSVIPASVAVEIDVPDQTGSVRIDPGQLDRVLLNLVFNARDAMPDGGTLTIACTTLAPAELPAGLPKLPAAYVVLAVSDTGQGIPPDILDRVFEPFFSTKDVGEGSGLGLATCYGVVRQAGGEIRVDSRLGQGSTFLVYLPRVPVTAAVAPRLDVAPRSPELTRGHETVLVVEDDPTVQRVTVQTLRAAGYEVLAAEDGISALELFADLEEPLDLLLTDVVMPRLGGLRLASSLRESQPELPVVFMSGYTRTPIPEGAANYFLAKPFGGLQLSGLVRAVLDARVGVESLSGPDGESGGAG